MTLTKQIKKEVLAVLSLCRVDGQCVFLPQQLDRKLYLQVNEVLEALGGKWERKMKAHVFADSPTDVLDMAILTGAFDKPQDFGYFPTPPELATQLVTLAGVRPGDRVLEPSAGQGALLDVILDRQPRVVVGIELLEKNMRVLDHRYDDDQRVHLVHGDFLQLVKDGSYRLATKSAPLDEDFVPDCIVMNPPFAKRQDIQHVLAALSCLQRGGRLAAIMSAGTAFREDALSRAFRKCVDAYHGSITPLPEGSFKVSGTMVNTVVCTMEA